MSSPRAAGAAELGVVEVALPADDVASPAAEVAEPAAEVAEPAAVEAAVEGADEAVLAAPSELLPQAAKAVMVARTVATRRPRLMERKFGRSCTSVPFLEGSGPGGPELRPNGQLVQFLA